MTRRRRSPKLHTTPVALCAKSRWNSQGWTRPGSTNCSIPGTKRLRPASVLVSPFRESRNRIHEVVDHIRVRVFLPSAALSGQSRLPGAAVIINRIEAVIQGLPRQALILAGASCGAVHGQHSAIIRERARSEERRVGKEG